MGMTSKMTSMERVHAAAKGKPVDRVPLFIWLNAHTGVKLMAEYKPGSGWLKTRFAKFLWNRFIRGGSADSAELWRLLPLWYDVHMFNWANAYSIELGSDMVFAAHATPWQYAKFTYRGGRFVIKDLFGVTRGLGSGIYPDMIKPAVGDINDALNYPFPDTKNERLYNVFRRYRRDFPGTSICAEIWGPQDFTNTSLFGTEKFMVYLIEYPDEMKQFLKKWTDFQIEVIRNSVRAGADVVGILDDYGYDNSTFISVDMWKEFTYPELKRMVDAAHEEGALAMLHSCGYQAPLLEHYVEAGIDMLQSFQPKAGNDFESAYDEYGDRLTFITGIDVQRGEFMSPDELEREIVANYKIGKKHGRHILGTTHEMQYTMPDENVSAIFDTIEKIKAGDYD